LIFPDRIQVNRQVLLVAYPLSCSLPTKQQEQGADLPLT
jgi:hypothetical protein